MADPILTRAILEQIEHLQVHEQEQVLAFVRALTNMSSRGASGTDYLSLVGGISAADLEQMESAIEEGCEQVNPDEW